MMNFSVVKKRIFVEYKEEKLLKNKWVDRFL